MRVVGAGLVACLLAGGSGSSVLVAQAPPPAGGDSLTVVAGARYEAGGLHRWLLGSDYRDLWTTPLRVERLDLVTFSGGLTPTQVGGGRQTRSLRFRAADGREFQFRSVDKDPTGILPEELRETLAESIIQDQISSAHPVGALVVAPILEAVGVLHAEPRLVVLPDDPRLGEFREEFANMLGMIEERPDENDTELAAFAGATEVVGTETLLERLEEDLELLDSRAFLAARLTDLFLGDWDRHLDQWRWARFGDRREDRWSPIPRDRDQAFARMDGMLLVLARTYYPQFVRFEDEYSGMLGFTWNGRDLDRRFLVDLDWPTWDSVAVALQATLTDEVINDAVGALPPELQPLNADALRRRLVARRDGLDAAARAFYEHLAGEVEIHTTDAPEIAEVQHLADGGLEVAVRARESAVGPVPIYRRSFSPEDTKEIRLVLHGGEDSVRVFGPRGSIDVRVVGGGGADTFVDQVGGAHFYDTGGQTVAVYGPGTTLDTREFVPPPITPSPLNRDWGRSYRFPISFGFSPDIGFLAGLTVERYAFGFRRVPVASRGRLKAAWGTTANTYDVEGEALFYGENTTNHWAVRAAATGLDVLRFHGFGNETTAADAESRFELERQQFTADVRYVVQASPGVLLSLGPTIRYSDTSRPPDWLAGQTLPLGMERFGQVGLGAEIALDGRDRPRSSTTGASLTVSGHVFPPWWDAEKAFGDVRAEASGYLTPAGPFRPTLALRVGAQKVFGTFPFHEAAFLGDAETVRLGRKQRFSGDASAYANAELRLKLARIRLVLPADVGVFGLYDVGRVWLEGEDSDRWHDAVGGGIWLAFLRPENAFTLAIAQSAERTGIYLGAGFAF